MHPFHREITVIALKELASHGYALVGGYSLQAHGISNRPSSDVDLFTDADVHWKEVGGHCELLVAAFGRAGITATYRYMQHGHPHHRLLASRGKETTEIDLNFTTRLKPPVVKEVGPVQHLDDVAMGKMKAMSDRSEPRDAIDVYLLRSSGYTRARLLEIGSMHVSFTEKGWKANAHRATKMSLAKFTRYGVDASLHQAIIGEFSDWLATL